MESLPSTGSLPFDAWLISELSSKDDARRAKALQTLDGLGADGIDVVMTVVRKEARKQRLKQRWKKVWCGLVLVFTVAMSSWWIYDSLRDGRWSSPPWQLWLQTLSVTAGLFGAYAVTSAQSAGTKWLAQFKDPRLVVPLLDALDADDAELKKLAEETLVDRLPALSAEHSGLLSPEQRATLRRLLRHNDFKLVTSALKGLVALAEVAAIPDVEALMRRLAAGKKPERELLETARASLDELLELKQRARERETLLRPAGSAPGENLLRAASGQSEADSGVLLRAAVSTEPGT